MLKGRDFVFGLKLERKLKRTVLGIKGIMPVVQLWLHLIKVFGLVNWVAYFTILLPVNPQSLCHDDLK